MKTTYWASAPDTEIANEINSKFESHLLFLQRSGHSARIQKSYDTYYNRKIGGFGVDMEDEAISRITVPHYKNLLSRIHMMTVQAKLSFQPKAVNSDSKSLLQTDLAKGLLDAQIQEGLSQITSTMVEQSLVMFGSYVYAPWNRFKGDKLRPDENGKMIFSGDQEFHNLSIFDVAREQQKDSPWYIVETQCNKWDLLANYPDKENEILSGSNKKTQFQLRTTSSQNQDSDSDLILIKTLMHRPTSSLPEGRITVICNDTVLEDSIYYYKTMPVVYMEASSVLGQDSLSDSPASSLIGLQEVLDRVYSANITNVLNGCVSNIYSPDPNLSVTELRQGQTLITASQPPVAVSLTGVSPDAINLVNDLINQETLLSGLNNTARGNPESSLKSGTSLSLVLSTAIQYINGNQQNYAKATADIATIIIHNLQTFAKSEKIAFIAGISNKAQAKAFTSKDIEGVYRISCELGNPITQTVAGRMELVQMLLQYGAIKDPAKIDDFLRTGNWESLTEDSFSESQLIRSENELLRRGNQPVVILTDSHQKHIKEHLTVLYSQESRNDPEISKAVLDHVQNHIDALKNTPQDLAAILGQQPLPSQQIQNQDLNKQNHEVMGVNLPSSSQIPEGFREGYDNYSEQIASNPASEEI